MTWSFLLVPEATRPGPANFSIPSRAVRTQLAQVIRPMEYTITKASSYSTSYPNTMVLPWPRSVASIQQHSALSICVTVDSRRLTFEGWRQRKHGVWCLRTLMSATILSSTLLFQFLLYLFPSSTPWEPRSSAAPCYF